MSNHSNIGATVCISYKQGYCSSTVKYSQVALVVKNSPTKARDAGDMGSIPGWGRSFGVTHSSTHAWRSSWTEEPGRLWIILSQRVGHDQSDLAKSSKSGS